MVTLYTDARMMDHRPPSGHPERPDRLSVTLRHLERTGQFTRYTRPELRPAIDAELQLVHSAAHIREVGLRSKGGGGQVEEDTWVTSGSDLSARLAVGAVIDAVNGVMIGPERRAFCLVRPPGHHARPNNPMGFCLYGSVAVGVAHALSSLNLNRILVVDWDVHHGNGTQEIYYEDPRVGFLSMHRHPFYPGGGLTTETGTGAGIGTTRNLPIKYGTSRAEILRRFQGELGEFADQVKPELIVLSAGFDAHAQDPVGDLRLEYEDFDEMSQMILEVAAEHSSGRVVSVLEGGYNVPVLAGCISNHLQMLEQVNDPGGI